MQSRAPLGAGFAEPVACMALTTPWMMSHLMDDCCARGEAL